MMSKLAVFLMTATAFAPALLVYAWLWAAQCYYLEALYSVTACVVLVFLCLGLLAYARKNLQVIEYTPKSIETADSETMNFLLIYLMPLITRDLAMYNWHVWIVIAIIFCFVVSTSYSYHFNPLLVIFRYHFYKVSDKEGMSYVLITRRRLVKANEELRVVRLSEYVLIGKD